MSVGANIRTRREALGLTQAHVAAQAGVSQAMVSQIERGTKALTVGLGQEIAGILQCSLGELIGEQEKSAG